MLACDVEIKMRISFFKKEGPAKPPPPLWGGKKGKVDMGLFREKSVWTNTQESGNSFGMKGKLGKSEKLRSQFLGPMPGKKKAFYQALKKTLSLFAGKNGGKRFQILVFLLLLFLTLGIIHLAG